METSRVLLIILSIFFLAGCATTEFDVNYDYDAGIDFSTLKTYNWLPLTASSVEGEWIATRIRREVDTQLQAKGFAVV